MLLPFLVVGGGLLAVVIGAKTGVADGFGGLCSIAAGWIGMQGATVTGVMLALFMANAGGAWDIA